MTVISLDEVAEGSFFLWYGEYSTNMKSVWLCRMLKHIGDDASKIQKYWGWVSLSMYGDPFQVMQYDYEERFLDVNFSELSDSSTIFDLDPTESLWQNMDML